MVGESMVADIVAACTSRSDLATELGGADVVVVSEATPASPNVVMRFVSPDRTLFAKVGPSLAGEAERLDWLAGRCGAPSVEFAASDGVGEQGNDLVVMTEVVGLGAHHAMAGDPNGVVAAFGTFLASMHELPVDTCPFDARPDTLHAAAGELVATGGSADLGGTYAHLSADELFSRLTDMRPPPPGDDELVVVHGDYRMPNVLFDGSAVSGAIGVGRLGMGDRYCDLGAAARSLVDVLGPEALPVFFDAYGLARPEMLRLDYHVVLQELL